MRRIGIFLLLVAGCSVISSAKPRVGVKVHVEEEIDNVVDLRSNGGGSEGVLHSGGGGNETTYLNVTLFPDNPPSFQNNGKWCFKTRAGETVHLVKGGDYMGSLGGDFLTLELPQSKGKPLHVELVVYDRKWHTRLDIR